MKTFEKLLILLVHKMDADKSFRKKALISILTICCVIAFIVLYGIFMLFLWLFAYNYSLFNMVIAIIVAASFSWIIYTEKR